MIRSLIVWVYFQAKKKSQTFAGSRSLNVKILCFSLWLLTVDENKRGNLIRHFALFSDISQTQFKLKQWWFIYNDNNCWLQPYVCIHCQRHQFCTFVCTVKFHPGVELLMFYVEPIASYQGVIVLLGTPSFNQRLRGHSQGFVWEARRLPLSETIIQFWEMLCCSQNKALTLWNTVSGLWSSSPLLVTGISAAELLWDSSVIVLCCNEEGDKKQVIL